MTVTMFLENSPVGRIGEAGWKDIPAYDDQGVVQAPFDDDQVESLNAYQRAGVLHPYVCGRDSSHYPLVASPEGWRCLFGVDSGDPYMNCDYTQGWAHVFTATWGWRRLVVAQLPHVNGRRPGPADLVEMWHTLPEDDRYFRLPLHGFLGLSWERYKTWIHGDRE